jgi:hypothetical protein
VQIVENKCSPTLLRTVQRVYLCAFPMIYIITLLSIRETLCFWARNINITYKNFRFQLVQHFILCLLIFRGVKYAVSTTKLHTVDWVVVSSEIITGYTSATSVDLVTVISPRCHQMPLILKISTPRKKLVCSAFDKDGQSISCAECI